MIITRCYLTFYATSGSRIKSQVLDLKTLPIFSPLEMSVRLECNKGWKILPAPEDLTNRICPGTANLTKKFSQGVMIRPVYENLLQA